MAKSGPGHSRSASDSLPNIVFCFFLSLPVGRILMDAVVATDTFCLLFCFLRSAAGLLVAREVMVAGPAGAGWEAGTTSSCEKTVESGAGLEGGPGNGADQRRGAARHRCLQPGGENPELAEFRVQHLKHWPHSSFSVSCQSGDPGKNCSP